MRENVKILPHEGFSRPARVHVDVFEYNFKLFLKALQETD